MHSINEFLFHTPWWAPTALFFLGGFVFYSGNKRQERMTRNVGSAITVLAIALALVSYFVDTPIEKCTKRSKQLIYAVASRDWPKAESLLDPHCTLSVFNALTLYHNRDEMMKGAKAGMDRYDIKNVRIYR